MSNTKININPSGTQTVNQLFGFEESSTLSETNSSHYEVVVNNSGELWTRSTSTTQSQAGHVSDETPLTTYEEPNFRLGPGQETHYDLVEPAGSSSGSSSGSGSSNMLASTSFGDPKKHKFS
jgi:hypothetical protein